MEQSSAVDGILGVRGQLGQLDVILSKGHHRRVAPRTTSARSLIDHRPLAQRRPEDVANDVAELFELLGIADDEVDGGGDVVRGPSQLNTDSILILELHVIEDHLAGRCRFRGPRRRVQGNRTG